MDQYQFIEKVLPLRRSVLLYAWRTLKDRSDAEDVAQDVLLKLWQHRDELHRYISLEALTMQIAKRLCLNRLRDRRDTTGIDSVEEADEEQMPHERLENRDAVANVMRIIDQLPDSQRAIIRMKHIECLETEKIAELTGSNPEAVRVNLSRARKRIKELFLKLEK